MAENDIYNSKKQYETVRRKVFDGSYLTKSKQLKYTIRRKENLKYFKLLVTELEMRDLSFIRRKKFLETLRKVCSLTNKDLKDLDRDDVKRITAKLSETDHKTYITRKNFLDYSKQIWKMIFPEKDSLGRVDEGVTPYAWRIKMHKDKSMQRDRTDKFSEKEYAMIMTALNQDTRMQLYLSLIYECLVRPQELCYVNLEDVTVYDRYARIRISKRGKEGTKTLQVINSYYYLTKWLNEHPNKDDKSAPLFVTLSNNKKSERVTPKTANYMLKHILNKLGIKTKITNYSFKRNGVTHRYINGEPPQNIQKIAGWTSTQQLKTYDFSDAEDFFKMELVKRGIVKEDELHKKKIVTFKQCFFCDVINPVSNENCDNCKRPLNRNKILEELDEKKKKEDAVELLLKLVYEGKIPVNNLSQEDKTSLKGAIMEEEKPLLDDLEKKHENSYAKRLFSKNK